MKSACTRSLILYLANALFESAPTSGKLLIWPEDSEQAAKKFVVENPIGLVFPNALPLSNDMKAALPNPFG